jgi:hypothetical protein
MSTKLDTFAGIDGTLDVKIVELDPGSNKPENIWNRNGDNEIDCTIVLSGPVCNTYHDADQFQLVAYFDQQTPAGTTYQFPPIATTFLGSDGKYVSVPKSLTFDPTNIPACKIKFPAMSLLPGPYRVTVILTHNPDPVIDNPRMAGFMDLGVIQVFD